MKKSENYISSFSLKLYNLCQRIPFFRYLKVILYFTDFFLLLFLKKPKYDKNRKKKEVFIIYNYAFGDGMIWLCSAKHLRELYPREEYYITLICQKGLNSIYENENIFDDIIPYDLTKSTFNIKVRFNLFKLLRQKYYDIVLDPIGVGECTTNVFMSRTIIAKEKISIIDTTLNEFLCPKWLYKRIYTKIIEIKTKNLSLLEYYAEFIRGLGLRDMKIQLNKTKTKELKLSLPKEYYIIFPSASTLLKRWPIERYAEIVKRIYKKTKLPLLFCGTTCDVDSINQLKNILEKEITYFEVVNKTTLLEFVEIIKKAKFIVTNDTSTYHLAVINEVPVTIIVGGYTYDRYVSYKFHDMYKYKRPFIVTSDRNCFNCDNKCKYLKSNDKVWPCLNDVTIETAWETVERMIEEL